MRILHVIPNLSARSGGPTTVLRALSKYQVRAGLDITICTTNWGTSPQAGNSPSKSTQAEDESVRYLHFSYLTPLLLSPTMAKWLGKRLGDFDLVHIHGLYRFPVTYAAWLARRTGVSNTITPHGSLDPFLYKTRAVITPAPAKCTCRPTGRRIRQSCTYQYASGHLAGIVRDV